MSLESRLRRLEAGRRERPRVIWLSEGEDVPADTGDTDIIVGWANTEVECER
jgi:hypothetical protein